MASLRSPSSLAASAATYATPRLVPGTAQKTRVLWLRNNLRVDDNLALLEAAGAAAARGEALLPLYCLDLEATTLRTTKFGSPKCSPRRTAFLLEALADLDASLGLLGSGLVVSPLSAAATLRTLGAEGVAAVHVMSEVTSEELRDERAVAQVLRDAAAGGGSGSAGTAAPAPLVRTWDGTLYHADDLPRGCDPSSMPLTFTPWKSKVEGSGPPRAPQPAPASLPPLPPLLIAAGSGGSVCLSAARADDATKLAPFKAPPLTALGFSAADAVAAAAHDPRATLAYQGGERAAVARLQGWAFDRNCLQSYFDTRNGLVGADYSTKLAPWLALGCISARRVHSEVKRFERSPGGVANKSTYWVVFELLWRDFFKFMGAKVGTKLFERTGPVPPKGPGAQAWRDPRRDPAAAAALAAWKQGATGVPFVDANMRELLASGFMSNRGRQNVASFLVHDLNLDWRSGADHFETHLLDYDVCSNWGNWVAMAGLTGGRVNRFNLLKQSRDYDPGAEFVHLWVPELQRVPAPLAFEPWRLSGAQQAAAGVRVGGPPDGNGDGAAPAAAAAAAAAAATSRYPERLPCPGSAEAFFAGGGGSANKASGGGGRGYRVPGQSDGAAHGGGSRGKGGGGGNGLGKPKASDRPGRGKRGGRVQSSYMADFE